MPGLFEDRGGRPGGEVVNRLADDVVLEQPAVAGAIVGTRLGLSEHIAENQRVFSFSLEPADYVQIEQVLVKSRDLMTAIGDCGDEYR